MIPGNSFRYTTIHQNRILTMENSSRSENVLKRHVSYDSGESMVYLNNQAYNRLVESDTVEIHAVCKHFKDTVGLLLSDMYLCSDSMVDDLRHRGVSEKRLMNRPSVCDGMLRDIEQVRDYLTKALSYIN